MYGSEVLTVCLEITVSTANLSLCLVPCLYIECIRYMGFGTPCIDMCGGFHVPVSPLPLSCLT